MYHQRLYDPNHLDDSNRFQDAEPSNIRNFFNKTTKAVGKAVGKAAGKAAKTAKAVKERAKAYARGVFGAEEINGANQLEINPKERKTILMTHDDKTKLINFIKLKKDEINNIKLINWKCSYLTWWEKKEEEIYIFIGNEKKQINGICVTIYDDGGLKHYRFNIYLKNGNYVTIKEDLKQRTLQTEYLIKDINNITENIEIINFDMNSIEGIKKTTIKPFTITLYTKNGKTWDEYKKNNIKRLVLNLQYNEGDYNQEMSIPYGKKAGKFADHLLDTKNISNIIWDRPYHGEIKGIDFTKKATQTLSKSITISLNLYTGTELFYIIEVSVDKEKFSEFIKDQNVEKNELHFVYDMCYSFFCKYSIFKT